jgi:hypothetical protein
MHQHLRRLPYNGGEGVCTGSIIRGFLSSGSRMLLTCGDLMGQSIPAMPQVFPCRGLSGPQTSLFSLSETKTIGY